MAEYKTTVVKSGPFFDGRARAAIRDFEKAAREDVADQGRQDMRAATTVFRHPTGYYKSRIQTRDSGSRDLVTDSGVVYGPWLEGTSSRNQSSRFKGYKIWRLTTQRLRIKVNRIAKNTLNRYIGRMN